MDILTKQIEDSRPKMQSFVDYIVLLGDSENESSGRFKLKTSLRSMTFANKNNKQIEWDVIHEFKQNE